MFAMKKRAILSVSDKTGIVEFAKELEALGYEVVSTGGTAKVLRENGVQVTGVSDITGFPECLDGRVKTLHPLVHAGILAMRSNPEHMRQVEELGVTLIDVVAINLYPFKQTILKPGVQLEEAIENIDIGGPTMIRAAAKNWQDVAVVVDPADYKTVIDGLKAGGISKETKFELAYKVFEHTASYDAMICNYLRGQLGKDNLPDTLTMTFEKVQQMRYGENPHQKAAFYRDQVTRLEKAKKDAEENHTEESATVTAQDMQKIVEEKTNIPVGDLQQQEENQLRDLDKELEAHVIGQNQAVDKVARAIRRNRIGLNKSGRPIGSFLFVGPTGVGKTETAKQLAKQLFGSKDAMIRFDMSEYMDKTSTSKLIGAAPGYVGYEEAGQLTEQVRRHPYSLILLDEVEKAHPDVMHMFLQILDDGRLTDSQGRTVSFKDTIIIMTSNAGTGDAVASVGFGAEAAGSTHSIIDKLTNYFKPEFLNRFDDIVQFNALTKEDLMKIVNLMIDDVNRMLKEKDLHITVPDDVDEKLVDLGYDPKMGARPLRRVIQEQIEDRIADYVLDHGDVHDLAAQLDSAGNITVVAAGATQPAEAPAENK